MLNNTPQRRLTPLLSASQENTTVIGYHKEQLGLILISVHRKWFSVPLSVFVCSRFCYLVYVVHTFSLFFRLVNPRPYLNPFHLTSFSPVLSSCWNRLWWLKSSFVGQPTWTWRRTRPTPAWRSTHASVRWNAWQSPISTSAKSPCPGTSRPTPSCTKVRRHLLKVVSDVTLRWVMMWNQTLLLGMFYIGETNFELFFFFIL